MTESTRLALLAAAFLSLVGCQQEGRCDFLAGDVPFLTDVPPDVPLDVAFFVPDVMTPPGDITVRIISHNIPGVSFEGLRLVGTPTVMGNFSVAVELRHEDPGICPRTEVVNLRVRPLECASQQACWALSGAPCSVSSDCTPSTLSPERCVELVDGQGVCVSTISDCRGDLTLRQFTDVEGRMFDGCGEDLFVECEAPGYCRSR